MSGARRIGIVGAGAVGGFVAGMAVHSGRDIVVLDGWDDHVQAIRNSGLRIESVEDRFVARMEALNLNDAQSLKYRKLDVVFICVKMYDTAWATTLVEPFLAPGGYIVTMQNGIMEPVVAGIAGWERTLGCIASTLSTHLVGPGHIVRTQAAGGASYDVFRVGEIHGRSTRRTGEVADILAAADSVRVTSNLWGERWVKLVENSMTSGVCGVTGLEMLEFFADERLIDLMIQLAAEGIAVGQALGYEVDTVRGLEPATWPAALAGDAAARARARDRFIAETARMTPKSVSGTAQDIGKGRMTEVDYMNGFLAGKGAELGIPVPANAMVAELVRRIERREVRPGRQLIGDGPWR